MTISAEDAAATLAQLVPGFIALSIFYWFGVRIKRPDWQWLIWSLIATVPIAFISSLIVNRLGLTTTDLSATIATCGLEAAQSSADRGAFEEALKQCATDSIAAHNAGWELIVGIILAVIGAVVAIYLWRQAAARWPELSSRTELQAWQSALTRGSRWLEVKTEDGVFSGYNREVANPAETDDLDIYLGDPAVLKRGDPARQEADQWVDIPGVEGLLIRRDDIKWIKVLE